LVREIYGQIISSVPLFFGLQMAVLTELCLQLKATPALKGQTITREGSTGYDMYVVESGICRVTQHLHIGDDTERARGWITEVFASHLQKLNLYSPNEKQILEQLLKAIKKLTRRKKRAGDIAEKKHISRMASRDAMQSSTDSTYDQEDTLDTLFGIIDHDRPNRKLDASKIRWLLEQLSELKGMDIGSVLPDDKDGLMDTEEFSKWWTRRQTTAKDINNTASALRRIRAGSVYYRDLEDDQEIDRLMEDTDSSLRTMLQKAARQGLIEFTGPLPLQKDRVRGSAGFDKLGGLGKQLGSASVGKMKQLRGNREVRSSKGPRIIVSRRSHEVTGETTTQLLCDSLRDGVVLCQLLNFFLPPKERVPVWMPSLLGRLLCAHVLYIIIILCTLLRQNRVFGADYITDVQYLTEILKLDRQCRVWNHHGGG
jgi:hypothetical protein